MLVLWLLLLPLCSVAGTLVQEPTSNLLAAFQGRQPNLLNVWVAAKKPVDSSRSVLVATAFPRQRSARNVWVGVFVVSGPANRIDKVLDIRRAHPREALYELDNPTASEVHVHVLGYFSIYLFSDRYEYELQTRAKPRAVRYTRFGFGEAVRGDKAIVATGVSPAWDGAPKNEGARIGALLRAELDPEFTAPLEPPRPEVPVWVLSELPSEVSVSAHPPQFVRVSDSRWIVGFRNPGYREAEFKPDILILEKGEETRHATLPALTTEKYRTLRSSGKQSDSAPWPADPLGLNIGIGSMAWDGRALWFATTFHCGEGFCGVGAIGRLDPDTLRIDMHYLPEIVPWSASALIVDGDVIRVGLMHRPEGMPVAGGLLAWNRRTGEVQVTPIPDVIRGIYRLGEEMWLTTEHGLYRQRGGRWTIFRPEPDSAGKLAWRVVTPDFP